VVTPRFKRLVNHPALRQIGVNANRRLLDVLRNHRRDPRRPPLPGHRQRPPPRPLPDPPTQPRPDRRPRWPRQNRRPPALRRAANAYDKALDNLLLDAGLAAW